MSISHQEAWTIANRYFDPRDAECDVLSALAATGEITVQTADALTDFHAAMFPRSCACPLQSVICDVAALRGYVVREGLRSPNLDWPAMFAWTTA